ncbi:MAG TPA: hypothetical protein VNE59_01280 [Burkholderiales bacterium]|nr:hypothetical protein [Burkholderiales bacterium]
MEPARIEARPFLVIERRYPVAPEKLRRAWTDPQAMSRWWGYSFANLERFVLEA